MSVIASFISAKIVHAGIDGGMTNIKAYREAGNIRFPL